MVLPFIKVWIKMINTVYECHVAPHWLVPSGELMVAIQRDFGSFQALKEKMSGATVAVQGSGWGWLGYDKESGRLRVAACPNQDPLQGTTG